MDAAGAVTELRAAKPLLKGEILDATVLRMASLEKFIAKTMAEAKAQGLLFSVHLKATMMKVSDPVLFGAFVRVFFKDVFTKYADLFKELGGALKQLKDLIVSINRTNQETVWEGKTLTELIAEKDTLAMHIAALRAALDAANVRSDRYSRNEIKFVRTIDVNALQKRVDDLSRDLRQLDSQLQQANWTTDLK